MARHPKHLKPQHPPKINYPKVLLWAGLLVVLFMGLPLLYHYAKQELPGFEGISWTVHGELPAPSLNAIKKSIQPLLKVHYSDIDTHQIKDTILKNAWVKSVVVRRPFWSKLAVVIRTRKIAMRFNHNGYIDSEGEVFTPEYKKHSELPLMVTPVEAVASTYKAYQLYQKILGEQFQIKLIKQAQTTELVINNNTTLKLGYDKQTERLKNFVKLYPRLQKKYPSIDHLIIDFRYKKGMSIATTTL